MADVSGVNDVNGVVARIFTAPWWQVFNVLVTSSRGVAVTHRLTQEQLVGILLYLQLANKQLNLSVDSQALPVKVNVSPGTADFTGTYQITAHGAEPRSYTFFTLAYMQGFITAARWFTDDYRTYYSTFSLKQPLFVNVTPTLIVHAGVINNNQEIKVAAFDLDWTLVSPTQGIFPRNADDWQLLPKRLEVLTSYQSNGYTLVIFTNQGYTGKKLDTMIQRISNIFQALYQKQINPWVLIATGKDNYRKPNRGMWDIFARYLPAIDLQHSLYVGDAAGRASDHSSDDLLFARNVGLPFYVPVQVFA